MQLTPMCPYCQEFSVAATGREIYPHRKDLYQLNFYSCVPCNAYVGTHPNTTRPLGRLANKELRQAKSAVHRAFDPLWELGSMKRKDAYVWLANILDISKEDCHIGMFDLEACEMAEKHALCEQYRISEFYNEDDALNN